MLGARGRNDGSIDRARLTAIEATVAEALGAQTFFANPYCSWERGINENTNGLLRQFFPKGTDFKKVSYKKVYEAVDLLNKRPRKTRGYLSPNEIFLGELIPVI